MTLNLNNWHFKNSRNIFSAFFLIHSKHEASADSLLEN